MKYNITPVDKMLMTKIQKGKRDLIEDLDRNITNQELCLDEFIKGINECDNKNLPNTKAVWNLSALINIISLDLKVIQRDLYASHNNWTQRYFIRQAYLLIYEFFNTYYSQQKEFYEIVNNKLNISSLDTDKEKVIKGFREYKKKHDKTFYSIRNNTIGHREKDIVKQVEYIEQLNFATAIEIMLEFDQLLNQTGDYFQKIIDAGLKDIDLLQ